MAAYPRSLLRHRVTLAAFVDDGAEGDIYAGPVPDVPAYVEHRAHLVVDRRSTSLTFGQEITARTLVLVPLEHDIQPRGRVTVWAGTDRERTSEVIDSIRFDDADIPSHIEIHLE